MKKAIIFDFDGVIVESEDTRFKFLQNILKEHNITVEGSEIPPTVGITTTRYLEGFIKDKNTLKALINKYQEGFKKNILQHITPVNITHLFIKEKPKHLKFGMATMNTLTSLKEVLTHFKLDSLFDAFLTVDQIENHKPHPEIYLKAAEKLGVKPKECIVIEDSPTGAKAAVAAGMDCYIIKNKYNDKKHFEGINIKGYIHTLEDLQKLI